MKCQVDEMSSWWNVKLMKCPVDEMSSWWNVQLMKCQVDEMSSWWIVKFIFYLVDVMSSWQNVELTKCKVDKMTQRLFPQFNHLSDFLTQIWRPLYPDRQKTEPNFIKLFIHIIFCHFLSPNAINGIRTLVLTIWVKWCTTVLLPLV